MLTSSHYNLYPLHSIIAKSSTIKELKKFLRLFSVDEIRGMALSYNHKNKFPIDLVETTTLGIKEKYLIKKLLLRCMLPANFKKMSEPLLVDDVLKQYPLKDGRVICNLIIATIVSNETRKVIHYSCTHPEMNETIDSEGMTRWKEIFYKINEFRLPQKTNTDESKQPEIFYQKMALIEKFHMGNCLEFAEYVYYILTQNKYSFSVEIFSIIGGDHSFVVMDRKSGSNPADPTTWGSHCVICDAWSGKVFLSHEINTYLQAFTKADLPTKPGSDHFYRYNILMALHPNIHTLQRRNFPLQEIKDGYASRYVSPFFSNTLEVESKKRRFEELKSFVPYQSSYAKKLKETSESHNRMPYCSAKDSSVKRLSSR